MSLHLTLPRSLRFLLHFRRRRNCSLSPTLLLTCTTKIILNIHHNQPIEACYTQKSCLYKEFMSPHLTLPRFLRFLLHFRRRRNCSLSPTLLLGLVGHSPINVLSFDIVQKYLIAFCCFLCLKKELRHVAVT